MQLSLKPNIFSNYLVPFLQTVSNFERFGKKKMIPLATLFRKLQTVKDLVRPLSKKYLFRNSFKNQHVKESQTLVKYASEHFHHLFLLLWETLIWKIAPLVIW